jgi:hypothetical protein
MSKVLLAKSLKRHISRVAVEWRSWLMPVIYPSLPGAHDFFGVRIGGNGIGNCLYGYCHAVVIAKKANARIITPTWWSIKIGPLLRGELSLRRYGTMFRPHPDEITGIMKFVYLLAMRPRKTIVARIGNQDNDAAPSGLTTVTANWEWTFVGLHPHRQMIRDRLLEILHAPPPQPPRWGKGDFIAAHIRLGDFIPVKPDDLKTGHVEGLRIPLTWYANVIRRMRDLFPDLPVRVFSDGRAAELTEILSIEGVVLWREPTDIDDLLMLSEARLIIGSNSTYSRWATFLGKMPSIWFKAEIVAEKPNGQETPVLYIGDDFETITRDFLIPETADT